MASILNCVRHAHDPYLTALAALICTLGVYAAFALSGHAGRSSGRARRGWAAVSVVATAFGVWSTHFILLIAFRPGAPAGFAPWLTAASLIAAILVMGAGVVARVDAHAGRHPFVSGAVMGVGVVCLHYIGMCAYRVAGEVRWDLAMAIPTAIVSVLIAGGSTVAATATRRWIRWSAAPLFLLSILVLHFGGMSAITVTYDPRIALPADVSAPGLLAPWVGGATLFVLALALLGVKFDLAAEHRRRRERARLEELTDVAVEGLLVCGKGVIVTANVAVGRLCGVRPGELAGRSAAELFPALALADLPEDEEREAELVAGDGQLVPVRLVRRALSLGGRADTVIAVRDQRERLRTEAQMRTLAFGDAVTGLANRARFLDLLSVHAASRRNRERGFAVLVIDLDRFKLVNDTLGHATGDRLLRLVAERLSGLVRPGEAIARLSADEFAILQIDMREPGAVDTLALRVIEALARPFELDGHILNLGASVGVAQAPHDGADPAELLRNADLALHKAKADGKGVHRRYDPSLHDDVLARQAMEAGLRRALEQGQLELHFQPLQDVRSRRVSGAEALVRWRHPERGLISPAVFIPVAEETGLIHALGEQVLRLACAEAASWPEPMTVAVNLSPVQFRDARLTETVARVLADTGLAPRRLELEITEGVLLSDDQRVLETLAVLRASGVRLSLDDFGTGYSSMSYLRRFRFDKLKIDQSFVRPLPLDSENAAIVRAIIALGEGLGMSITAEGVETAEQLAFIAAEGCDQAQGYLISRPLPAAAFRRFVDDHALAAA